MNKIDNQRIKQFYEMCLKNNHLDLNDSFQKEKIRLYAIQTNVITKEEQITAEDLSYAKEIYDELNKKEKELAEKEELKKQLAKEVIEAKKYDLVINYKNIDGVKGKAELFLDNYLEANKYLASSDDEWVKTFYGNNGGGQGKLNPYVMGGLSQGIAGPVAGAISYYHTVDENKKIDAKNHEAMVDAVNYYLDSKPVIEKMRKEYQAFQNSREALKTAYVQDENDVARYIVGNINYEVSKTGTITLDVILSLDLDKIKLPTETSYFSADGIIRIIILDDEGNFVDSFYQALNIGGIVVDKVQPRQLTFKKIITNGKFKQDKKYNFLIQDYKTGLIEIDYNLFEHCCGKKKDLSVEFKPMLAGKDIVVKEAKKNVNEISSVAEADELINKLKDYGNNKETSELIDKANKIKGSIEKKNKKKDVIHIIVFAIILIGAIFYFAGVPEIKYNSLISKINDGNIEEATAELEQGKYSDDQTKQAYYLIADKYLADENYEGAFEIYNKYEDVDTAKEVYIGIAKSQAEDGKYNLAYDNIVYCRDNLASEDEYDELNSLAIDYQNKMIRNSNVGDVVIIGTLEEGEAASWSVIAKEDGKLLLLANFRFVAYGGNKLFNHLDDDVYPVLFNDTEKTRVIDSDEHKLFVLSLEQYNTYQNVITTSDYEWWLSTMNEEQTMYDDYYFVCKDGSVDSCWFYTDKYCRPSVWINAN